LIEVIPQEGEFPYLVKLRGRKVAQFVKENEAWAYMTQLAKAVRKLNEKSV